jgi:hypothetical protein
LLDPKLKLAFISACNPPAGLLVVYLFHRADFPWVGNWVERLHQSHAPWNGETFCRGLEFSTTPFAVPRRETVEQHRMFGETVYRWLPAKSEVNVRYVILLLRVPTDFRGVKSATVEGHEVKVIETGPHSRKISTPVKRFL